MVLLAVHLRILIHLNLPGMQNLPVLTQKGGISAGNKMSPGVHESSKYCIVHFESCILLHFLMLLMVISDKL